MVTFKPLCLFACVIISVTLSACGGGEEGDGQPVGVSDATARDVSFGQAAITGFDTTGFCPITNTFMRFFASGGISSPESLFQFTGESADFFSDNTVTRSSGLGIFRIALGEEVCASVSSSNWESSAEVCHTIESGTTSLTFPLSLARPALADPQCEFRINLVAAVNTVDTDDFCTQSCAQLDECGRVFENCVASCVDDMSNVPFGDNPICNTATQEWLSCLHAQSCAFDSPELRCAAILPDQNILFASNQCSRPVPPPPPLPDPVACTPEQGDLVAGNVGDFYVLSRATDFPNRYYAIIDLNQMAEIDTVLGANPGDPLLSTANSVVAVLRGLDGSSRDNCSASNIVSLQYEGSISPAFIALANSELGDIQDSLDQLSALAADLKKQAVAFLFENIFCPSVRSIYSFFFGIAPGGAAGIVLTEAAVVAHGCF